jgi:6,7-dimethyl-8-ribityllumazine synthase
MQEYSGRICQPPEGYIVIAVARFNKSITQRLLDGALAKLRQHHIREHDIRVVWVPGTFETPFVASHFAKDTKCLAIICLGAVIKGETTHDQHINRAVSMSLCEISATTRKPVIFGILTCDNIEQANARSGIIESAKDKSINPAPGNKGAEAAEAALEMIDLVTELPNIELDFTEFSDSIMKVLNGVASNIPHQILNGLNIDDDDFDDDVEEYDVDDDDDDLEDDEDYEYGTAKNIFFPTKRSKKTTKKTTKKQSKKKNK